MGDNIFRRLAFFGGVVALGSVVADALMLSPWKGSHNPAVPLLVLAGLVLAYSVGWVAKYILRRRM